MGVGLDVIHGEIRAERGTRNAGHGRAVHERRSFAENAVHEHRVVGGDGQIAMRLKGLTSPPPPPTP